MDARGNGLSPPLPGPPSSACSRRRRVSASRATASWGLATSAEKKFEVATIKENNSGSTQFQLGPPGRGSIAITNLTSPASSCSRSAPTATMMRGEPDWTNSTNYDIVGKGPDPKVTNPEVWEMMRSLLIERFHLKYHIEQRDMPVFALTVATRGHKLTLGENGRCKRRHQGGTELRRHSCHPSARSCTTCRSAR